jgi:hypothetical protein
VSELPEGFLRRTLVRHAKIAAAIFVIDGIGLGQGAIAFVAALIGGVLGSVQQIRWFAGGPRKRLVAGYATAAMYIVVAGLVVGYVTLQANVARDRAPELVKAVEHYRTDHGEYPSDLEKLVPAYVPSVPRARYTLMFGHFLYLEAIVRNRGIAIVASAG